MQTQETFVECKDPEDPLVRPQTPHFTASTLVHRWCSLKSHIPEPGSWQVVEQASHSKNFVRLAGIASRRPQTLRFWRRLGHLGNARQPGGSRRGLEPWVGGAGLGTRAGVSPQPRADREGPTHPQPLLCFVSSGFTSVPSRWRVYRPLAQARRKTPLKRQATSTQAEREEPRRTQHSPVVRLHRLGVNQSAQSGRLATHRVTQNMLVVSVVTYIIHKVDRS